MSPRRTLLRRGPGTELIGVTDEFRFAARAYPSSRQSDSKASLLDLFDGRRQLIVVRFMFTPDWDEGCSSCSAGADEVSDGLFAHLHTRDTTLGYVSRAPLAKIEAYKARKGWTFTSM